MAFKNGICLRWENRDEPLDFWGTKCLEKLHVYGGVGPNKLPSSKLTVRP